MAMNKNELLSQIIQRLRQTMETVAQSAQDAKDAATHEESLAENEYDTRGLEASYLAGAQAKRADEIKAQLAQLTALQKKGLSAQSAVQAGALVKVDLNGEREQWFFVLPVAGGEKVNFGGEEIHVVTPSAPIGQRLVGLKAGDEFQMQIGDSLGDYEVLEVL